MFFRLKDIFGYGETVLRVIKVMTVVYPLGWGLLRIKVRYPRVPLFNIHEMSFYFEEFNEGKFSEIMSISVFEKKKKSRFCYRKL